jgi:hypothetical protein
MLWSRNERVKANDAAVTWHVDPCHDRLDPPITLV